VKGNVLVSERERAATVTATLTSAGKERGWAGGKEESREKERANNTGREFSDFDSQSMHLTILFFALNS